MRAARCSDVCCVKFVSAAKGIDPKTHSAVTMYTIFVKCNRGHWYDSGVGPFPPEFY